MRSVVFVTLAIFVSITLMSCDDSDSGSKSLTGADIIEVTQNPSGIEVQMEVISNTSTRTTRIWVHNYKVDSIHREATHSLTLDGENVDEALQWSNVYNADWHLPTALAEGSSHSIVYHCIYHYGRETFEMTKSGTIVVAHQAVYDTPEIPTSAENPMPFSWTLPADNQYQVAIANSQYFDIANADEIKDVYIVNLATSARSYTFPANCVTLIEDPWDTILNYGIHSFNYSLSKKFLIISDTSAEVYMNRYGEPTHRRHIMQKLGEIIAKGI